MSRFYELFSRKHVMGMLHLGGNFPVLQAIDDLGIYERNGLDGVIVEDYHGIIEDVEETLRLINSKTFSPKFYSKNQDFNAFNLFTSTS